MSAWEDATEAQCPFCEAKEIPHDLMDGKALRKSRTIPCIKVVPRQINGRVAVSSRFKQEAPRRAEEVRLGADY